MKALLSTVALAVVLVGFAPSSHAQGPGQHVVQLTATEVFAENGTHDCWFTQTGVENVSIVCKTDQAIDLVAHASLGPIGSCRSGASDTISWSFCRPSKNQLTYDVTAGAFEQTGSF